MLIITDTTINTKPSPVRILAGIDFGDINQTGDDAGRPNEYYVSNKTLGNLMHSNEEDSNFMSVTLQQATLRQLMDAGLIEVSNEKLYTKTLNDIVSVLNGLSPEVLDQLFK